jgi:hypothetical protein
MTYVEKPAYKISVVQLQCTLCRAETQAACSCGAIYRPKPSERAAAAVSQHPEMSNRAIAAETGVSEATVRRARESTASGDAVEERTGLDGKKRKLPSYIPDPLPEIRDWLIEQTLDGVRQMTPPERIEFIRLVGRL